MSKKRLSKVFFGSRMVGYTGADRLNEVGRTGVLVVYDYVDADGECLPIFYFDRGWDIGWIRHSRSRYSLANGMFAATSVRSGTVKTYDVSEAVEMGAEVFQVGSPTAYEVPTEWTEVFLNVYSSHCWRDNPTIGAA